MKRQFSSHSQANRSGYVATALRPGGLWVVAFAVTSALVGFALAALVTYCTALARWDQPPATSSDALPGSGARPGFFLAAIDEGAAHAPGELQLADIDAKPIWLEPAPILTQLSVGSASMQVERGGEATVEVKLRPDGARAVAAFTSTHIGQRIAFVLDGAVLFAPRLSPVLGNEIDIVTPDLAIAKRIAVRVNQLANPGATSAIWTSAHSSERSEVRSGHSRSSQKGRLRQRGWPYPPVALPTEKQRTSLAEPFSRGAFSKPLRRPNSR
jgi:hypothetical protein